MLRLYQRVQARGLSGVCSTLREYSAWPADMSVPDGLKPYDPKGSMGQIDTYIAGLPENDGIVASVRTLRSLRVATDKLKAEQKAAGPSVPKGLATLPDGSVDADYYTKNQGIHADFVTGLKTIMTEEKSKQPTAKPFTAWADAWKAMEPTIAEAEKECLAELDELRKRERSLMEQEERLDDLTVDEALAMYPKLAQEIKDEIEAGEYDRTNAGHKLEAA